MKKLFLTLALTANTLSLVSMDNEISVVSSAPGCLTGPLAMLRNSGSNTPCAYSLSNLSSPKSTRSTPGHSRRPSMSLTLPTEVTPAKTTTGFQVQTGFQATPLTPPSSTTTSPRTPVVPEVVQAVRPTTPMSAQEWTEKTTAAFNLAVAAYNQQQADKQRRRFSLIEGSDRTELQSVIRYSWMTPEEEHKVLRVLQATIGDQL